MTTSRVLIITAVIPEARVLARAFHLEGVSGGVPMWRGEKLAVVCAGVRALNLKRLDEAGDIATPQLIVMAGVAGALSPLLRCGDVVVDVREETTGLPNLGRAVLGRIHTLDGIAETVEKKAELFRETGCLAVDMETDVVRQFAMKRQASFIAIRGILDTANEPLDPQLLTLVDGEGNPRVGRAMGMLCVRPWKLSSMLRLQKATGAAMGAVVETVRLVVASGWPAKAADRPANG